MFVGWLFVNMYFCFSCGYQGIMDHQSGVMWTSLYRISLGTPRIWGECMDTCNWLTHWHTRMWNVFYLDHLRPQTFCLVPNSFVSHRSLSAHLLRSLAVHASFVVSMRWSDLISLYKNFGFLFGSNLITLSITRIVHVMFLKFFSCLTRSSYMLVVYTNAHSTFISFASRRSNKAFIERGNMSYWSG